MGFRPYLHVWVESCPNVRRCLKSGPGRVTQDKGVLSELQLPVHFKLEADSRGDRHVGSGDLAVGQLPALLNFSNWSVKLN